MFAIPLLLKNWKIVAIAAGVLLLSTWALVERHRLIVEGEQRELKKIEDANNVAQKRAQDAADTVVACDRAGGDWNRDRGVCEHPAGK